ncbi:Zinc uptake regulation protein [Aquimixticola soesokkakensis]|uniref:Zinc uptake regulation protein n=1 Tax=Aquimixticola soesokkakensis TaxID=1519096 RepID=A0A1Y5RKM3_9RHOB|nr:Fur family transcriptional regulator [Aquimixticola soesokkakensis]SLN19422.1 Zinc uptake regulation protein [Aquimixticola soesokkakensis]
MTAPTPSDTAAAFERHDHSHCAGAVMQAAEGRARAEGLRLTPVRRRVLEILLEEHRALGAYDILDRLKAEGFGHQPPVAYRALDFLVEHGLAHRIRRLNAFAACMHPDTDHAPAFFICAQCSAVAESAATPLRDAAQAAGLAIGFTIERVTIEAIGTCPACHPGTAPSPQVPS